MFTSKLSVFLMRTYTTSFSFFITSDIILRKPSLSLASTLQTLLTATCLAKVLPRLFTLFMISLDSCLTKYQPRKEVESATRKMVIRIILVVRLKRTSYSPKTNEASFSISFDISIANRLAIALLT